jgi:hypothetical protein
LLQSSYIISPQWTAIGHFGYTRFEYIGSPRLDNAWLADAMLKYEIRRNLALTGEYQYTSIVSNAPLTSSKRNLIMMSILYKF